VATSSQPLRVFVDLALKSRRLEVSGQGKGVSRVNSAAVELSAFLPDEAATLVSEKNWRSYCSQDCSSRSRASWAAGKTTLARGILAGWDTREK